MSPMHVMDRAYEMHMAELKHYGPVRDRRLAHPFDVPEDMPEYEWRVSWDVMQALYEAAPPSVGPNPKSDDDGTARLFGWHINRDDELPPNSMLLEMKVPA